MQRALELACEFIAGYDNCPLNCEWSGRNADIVDKVCLKGKCDDNHTSCWESYFTELAVSGEPVFKFTDNQESQELPF